MVEIFRLCLTIKISQLCRVVGQGFLLWELAMVEQGGERISGGDALMGSNCITPIDCTGVLQKLHMEAP
ncbi:hypothetical protein B0G80_9242 [Paraburkholderia sp. BL6669N2]|nr:hypothetical protein B0G80_9242 [Paraburkholderia sp. BL6669N2]